MRPKDALEPTTQNGVVYKISCECSKVFIGETERSMRERIKEHDRDIRFARTQTFTVSEYVNERYIPNWSNVKSIDRVKEAIHIRLHTKNINRDSGIEISEAWIPTIKQHNSRSMRTSESTPSNSRNNSEDTNATIAANQRATNSDA